jgi:hypothetical protein
LSAVKFERFPATGSGSTAVEAPMHRFLLEIPGLFYLGYVPPLRVVNDFLKRGTSDAGMGGGCRWTPFSLSEPEYAAVRKALRQDGETLRGRTLRFAEVPDDVSRRNEWASWVLEQEIGIPYQEHLSLMDREEDLREQAESAARQGDERAAELHLKSIEAGMRLVEFSEPYMERYRNRGQG